MPSLKPDRPITSIEDDLLDRSRFVHHIAAALLSADRCMASGVILGLCGDWGSGKSSILNLVKCELLRICPDAVVCHFNPWLVSGRDDLIASFFSSLIAEIKARHLDPVHGARLSQSAEEAVRAIARYGAELSPLLDGIHPGLGSAGKFVAKSVGSRFEQLFLERSTLKRRKEDMAIALQELSVPVIVLIDELDRVEDAEVREMAQLVRSVADFNEVSYLLAYDERRVIEALGGSSLNRKLAYERGKGYLQKIVQVPIQAPVVFDSELSTMLDMEIESILRDLNFSRQALGAARYIELKGILIPRGLATSRDIKKLGSAVSLKLSMLGREVEWVDVLGMSALEMHAPILARTVRKGPNKFVFDGADYPFAFHMHTKKIGFPEMLRKLEPTVENDDWIIDVIAFLFPALSGKRRADQCSPDDIAFQRPLLTLLRLGIVPGHISRSEIDTLLQAAPSEWQRIWSKKLLDRSLDELVRRIAEIYDKLSIADHEKFWVSLAGTVRNFDAVSSSEISFKRRLARAVADGFATACLRAPHLRERAPQIIQRVVQAKSWLVASMILRGQFFALGVYGMSARDPSRALLSKLQIENLTKELTDRLTMHLTELFREADPVPLFLLNDVGLWGENERAMYENYLQDSPYAVDRLLLWMFGANFTSDRSGLEIFSSIDIIERMVRRRKEMAEFSSAEPEIVAAYSKAEEHVGLGVKQEPRSSGEQRHSVS